MPSTLPWSLICNFLSPLRISVWRLDLSAFWYHTWCSQPVWLFSLPDPTELRMTSSCWIANFLKDIYLIFNLKHYQPTPLSYTNRQLSVNHSEYYFKPYRQWRTGLSVAATLSPFHRSHLRTSWRMFCLLCRRLKQMFGELRSQINIDIETGFLLYLVSV